MKKYELTTNTKVFDGKTLYQIRALASFGDVHAGDFGGYIEKEDNLSQAGTAWVYGNALVSDNAQVYGNARVYGDAWVYGNAQVCGNALVSDNAWVCGTARVSGDARVSGTARVWGTARVCGDAWVSGTARVSDNAWVCGTARVSGDARVWGTARVCGDAWVSGNADYLTICPIGSRGDTTTFYRRRDGGTMVVCGCYHDTIDAFEARVKEVHHGTSHEAAYLAAVACARARVRTDPEDTNEDTDCV